jgi:hypothetical protein
MLCGVFAVKLSRFFGSLIESCNVLWTGFDLQKTSCEIPGYSPGRLLKGER